MVSVHTSPCVRDTGYTREQRGIARGRIYEEKTSKRKSGETRNKRNKNEKTIYNGERKKKKTFLFDKRPAVIQDERALICT